MRNISIILVSNYFGLFFKNFNLTLGHFEKFHLYSCNFVKCWAKFTLFIKFCSMFTKFRKNLTEFHEITKYNSVLRNAANLDIN